MAEPFQRAGWTAVLANYPLAPESTIDVIVDQAYQALAWVRSSFPAAERIVISGHSAGGQLTLMSILADQPLQDGGVPPIAAGITISGVFDLEPLRYTTINELIQLDGASAPRNSPIHLIRPCPVPLLVAVGAKETAEFRGQSERFADCWRDAGNRVERILVDGANHFTVLRAFADPRGRFQKKIWEFLDAI